MLLQGWGRGEARQRDGRQGGDAVVSYYFPRTTLLPGGQGSLYMNTPLPGPPRGGQGRERRQEEVGEGMREYDSGVQIPAEIL